MIGGSFSLSDKNSVEMIQFRDLYWDDGICTKKKSSWHLTVRNNLKCDLSNMDDSCVIAHLNRNKAI